MSLLFCRKSPDGPSRARSRSRSRKTIAADTIAAAILLIGSSAPSLLPAYAAPSAPAGAVASPIADKWAVVIGISQFADRRVPGLKFPAKDARDFYDFLTDPNEGRFRKDHVKLLLNEDATRTNIIDTLCDSFLPHAAAPGDLVVVYLSTHGSPAGADINGLNYAVAYDTQVNRLYATGLELRELLKKLKERVHTNRILLVLDTCYSGAGATDKGMFRTNFDSQGLAQGIGSLVITSSSANQRSYESENLKNGYFTYYLIDALKPAPDKEPIEAVFSTMKKRVEDAVRREKGEIQTPVMAGDFQGPKLVLGVPPTEVREAPETMPLANQENNLDGIKTAQGVNLSDYGVHKSKALEFMNKHQLWEASHELEEAKKANPDSVERDLLACAVLDEQGRHKEALETAKHAVMTGPDESAAHVALGYAYLHSGSPDYAFGEAQKATTLDPTNSAAHELLGFINEHNNKRTDQAEQEYKKALEINPLNVKALTDLGLLLEKENRNLDKAGEYFHRAVESDAEDWRAHLALGRYLYKYKNDCKGGLSEIQKAIELDPSNAILHSELGNIMSQSGASIEVCDREYHKAIELSPDLGYAHYVFARFLMDRRKRVDEAEKEYRQALKLDPDLDDARIGLGNLLVDKKQYAEADSQFKEALKINQRNASAHIGLAMIAWQLYHNYAQAEEEFRKAIGIDAKSSLAYCLLGKMLDQAEGKPDEGKKELQAAIKADDKNADAHYNLGLLLVSASKDKLPKLKDSDLKEALAEFEKAAALAPSQSQYQSRIAWMYINHGKLFGKKDKDAEPLLRKAIELNIADSQAHYLLGMLMLDDRRKSAEAELKTAHDEAPDDQEIQKAFERYVK